MTPDYPTFSCTVIFENADGEEKTQSDFSSLPEFFLAWENGAIKRRVKLVTDYEDKLKEFVTKTCCGEGSNAAWLYLTLQMQECFCWLQEQLSLSHKLLSYMRVEYGTYAAVNLGNQKFGWYLNRAKDEVVAESAAGLHRVFVPSIPLFFNFVEYPTTFEKDPIGTLEDCLNDLVKEIIMVDNARIIHLIKTSIINPPLLTDSFSPTSFSAVRQILWEKGLAVPTMLASPSVFVSMMNMQKIDRDMWFSPNEVYPWATGRIGKWADLNIFCGGSPKEDFHCGLESNYMYLLAPPQKVGLRTEKEPVKPEFINKSILGVRGVGWGFFGLQGALVFGDGVAHAKIG